MVARELYYGSDAELSAEEVSEFEELIPLRGRISYTSVSLDIAGLVRRLGSGDIVVPQIGQPDDDLEMNSFQRGFVWNRRQMDSFIESMLLGYPTPSLFFVNQGDGRMIVLDGQQRLETLRRFYSGLYDHDRVYRLSLKESPYDKMSYKDLEADARRFLDNTYLSATVIRLEDKPHAVEAIYDVFARLNSGGTKLTPHEIRMALYNGPFMQAIDTLNHDASWRAIYGGAPNKRFRDHELVLRIIALYMAGERYKKPLGGFLNSFAEDHRQDSINCIETEAKLFISAAEAYASLDDEKLFSTGERRQLNTSKADSLMVGAMRYINEGGEITKEKLERVLKALDSSEDYNAAISRATSDESSVRSRIESVVSEFNNA